jgi:Septum formation
MAAPTGVSSGSAPEPVVPEPPATEPIALGPAVPEPSQPASGENTAGVAVPEPSGPAYGENMAAAADTEPEPPADEPARKGRRISWQVTAGVVLVVIAVAAAAGALAVTTHGFRPKTVVTYRPAAVFSLRAGECINSSSNGLSVTVLSCATPHQAEVFATFRLAGSSWPGTAAVQQQASNGCANRLAGYVNPNLLNAGLAQEYVYPDPQAWQAGVRTVVCEVSAVTGPLSGSVRNGG